MTKVVISRRNGLIYALSVEGHSGYAPSGEDIVCAAVTTLVQALHIGLSDVLGNPVDSCVDQENTKIALEWHGMSPEVQAIAATICESFRALAETYPENVQLVEVQEDAS